MGLRLGAARRHRNLLEKWSKKRRGVRNKKNCLTIGKIALFALCFVLPQAAADEFYQGKTIRFIVGYAPGGGYDTYTRLTCPEHARRREKKKDEEST